MTIRMDVYDMRDAWDASTDVHCINGDDSAVAALRQSLDEVYTLADVQKWITYADIALVWSYEPAFEKAYCRLVEIAESDGVYKRPDNGVCTENV